MGSDTHTDTDTDTHTHTHKQTNKNAHTNTPLYIYRDIDIDIHTLMFITNAGSILEVYFSRGTLPTKKGRQGTTGGPSVYIYIYMYIYIYIYRAPLFEYPKIDLNPGVSLWGT